ncbi:DUF1571 domain-containing protein [Planctomicrobium sp. SH664]|uniref:DUF1571 domain-containing protein n=1 Tax=Planctomicrobium sp. SH664 TaxID=3448125 RepID=UPI003F5B0CA7
MRILAVLTLVTAGALTLWGNPSVESVPPSAAPTPEQPKSVSPAQPETPSTSLPVETIARYRPAPTADETSSARPVEDSQQGLQELIHRLEKCLTACQSLHCYTATLEQQVRIKGTLRDVEMVSLKVRRSPFSVYMQWQEDGQEVLYVEGQNDNRLLARPTRGLVSLRGVWKLRPDSPQAMKSSRYPVTKLGIEKLTEEILQFYQARHFSPEELRIEQSPHQQGKSACQKFVVTFKSSEVAREYSRSQLTFCNDSNLLIALENEGWSDKGRPNGLLEKYLYHDLKSGEVEDHEFESSNPAYHFAQD